MHDQHRPQAGTDGTRHKPVETVSGGGQVQAVQVDMALNGEVTAVKASEELRRDPSGGPFDVFGGVLENEPLPGFHQLAQSLHDLRLRVVAG